MQGVSFLKEKPKCTYIQPYATLSIRICDTENQKHIRARNRAPARLMARKCRRVRSRWLHPPSLPRHHPSGFPGSDATPKFALRAKNTELRTKDVSQIPCLSPEGRISVTRGMPKTDINRPSGRFGFTRVSATSVSKSTARHW